MEFNDLTPELQAKVRECKNIDDLVKLAKLEGMKLSDEQLDAIAGGSWNCDGYCKDNCYEEYVCPKLGK